MIDIATTKAYRDYPALTVRAAIAPLLANLADGDSITIGPVKTLKGTIMPTHTLQVVVHQVAPEGSVMVTRSTGDGSILVMRVE